MSTVARLRIDSNACDRCGSCLGVCEAGALKIGPGYVAVDWGRCDACGKCVTSCDAGAIRSRETAPGPARGSDRRARTDASKGATAGSAGSAPQPRATRPAASGPAGAHWSLSEAALVLVVAFALLVGVQSFVSAVAGGPWTGVAMLGYDGALVALLWYLARRNGSDPSHAYRIDGAPEWWSLPLALGVAVACWLFSVTYRVVVLAAGLQPSLSEGANLSRLFGNGPLGAFLTVAAVAIIGPMLEELLLRGVVLRAASARFGTWMGIAISAVAFAALHASLWSLLPLTVLGIGLGWLASKSRSLWPAIFAHVVYNAVLVGAALYTAGR